MVAPLAVVTLRTEVAVESAKGVTGLGSVKVVPSGAALNHEANITTGELNPLCEITVIVTEPLEPGVSEITLEDD
jgi:hypothetical protein